jgi:hypothetical protein
MAVKTFLNLLGALAALAPLHATYAQTLETQSLAQVTVHEMQVHALHYSEARTTNFVSQVTIPPGTQVEVLESAGGMTHLGISWDIEGAALPSDVWVQSEELSQMHLAPQRAIPQCYADVKRKLLQMRLVRTFPPGAAAWQGYDVLRLQYAFRPAAFSQNLPNGSVCVSEGGQYQCGAKKCGHIAIKIGYEQWYGAGVFRSPLLPGHYGLRCLRK